jgi:hypothetical protein
MTRLASAYSLKGATAMAAAAFLLAACGGQETGGSAVDTPADTPATASLEKNADSASDNPSEEPAVGSVALPRGQVSCLSEDETNALLGLSVTSAVSNEPECVYEDFDNEVIVRLNWFEQGQYAWSAGASGLPVLPQFSDEEPVAITVGDQQAMLWASAETVGQGCMLLGEGLDGGVFYASVVNSSSTDAMNVDPCAGLLDLALAYTTG